jgi:hypothetical protein
VDIDEWMYDWMYYWIYEWINEWIYGTYRSATSDDLSSSLSMKNMKSGYDIPDSSKPPTCPSENT